MKQCYINMEIPPELQNTNILLQEIKNMYLDHHLGTSNLITSTSNFSDYKLKPWVGWHFNIYFQSIALWGQLVELENWVRVLLRRNIIFIFTLMKDEVSHH